MHWHSTEVFIIFHLKRQLVHYKFKNKWLRTFCLSQMDESLCRVKKMNMFYLLSHHSCFRWFSNLMHFMTKRFVGVTCRYNTVIWVGWKWEIMKIITLQEGLNVYELKNDFVKLPLGSWGKFQHVEESPWYKRWSSRGNLCTDAWKPAHIEDEKAALWS